MDDLGQLSWIIKLLDIISYQKRNIPRSPHGDRAKSHISRIIISIVGFNCLWQIKFELVQN